MPRRERKGVISLVLRPYKFSVPMIQSKDVIERNMARNKKDEADKANTPAEVTANADDPIGACQFTNASGQPVCLDNVRKSECDRIPNSIFIEGGSCE